MWKKLSINILVLSLLFVLSVIKFGFWVSLAVLISFIILFKILSGLIHFSSHLFITPVNSETGTFLKIYKFILWYSLGFPFLMIVWFIASFERGRKFLNQHLQNNPKMIF